VANYQSTKKCTQTETSLSENKFEIPKSNFIDKSLKKTIFEFVSQT